MGCACANSTVTPLRKSSPRSWPPPSSRSWRNATPANCRAAAAARRAGARAGGRAADPLAGRAALQPRRQLREEMRFEIRRLHDQYRYTTVYVTHDQSEAMTTADLIAVMNGGKIDQLGTPEDIYDRPQSEFVARFIGASNVLKGTARDENHISFAGATLRVVGRQTDAQPKRRGRDPPARHPAFGHGAGNTRQHRQGHRDPPGVSRRQPRLHGRDLGRHDIARHYIDANRRPRRHRGLADAAGRTLPGTQPMTQAIVIASEAKRSMVPYSAPWIASSQMLLAMTGKGTGNAQSCNPTRCHQGRDGVGAFTVFATPVRAEAPPPVAITRELIEAAKKEGKVVLVLPRWICRSAKNSAAPSRRNIRGIAGADRARRLRAAVSAHRARNLRANIHAADVVNSSDASHFIPWKKNGWLAPFVPEDVSKDFPGPLSRCRRHVRDLAGLAVVDRLQHQPVKPTSAEKLRRPARPEMGRQDGEGASRL